VIAGCYTVDLYCENADSGSPGKRGECPTSWHYFPSQYTGETWGECIRQARRRGWTVTRDRLAYCPDCSGKRKP
jgi:hypothetical protein